MKDKTKTKKIFIIILLLVFLFFYAWEVYKEYNKRSKYCWRFALIESHFDLSIGMLKEGEFESLYNYCMRVISK